MVFSSIPFLYYFLPAVLLLYFIAPRKIKNYVLLAFSLFFYFYGEKKLVFLMVFTAMWDYLCSLSIDFFRRRNNKVMPKVSLVLSLLVDLGRNRRNKHSAAQGGSAYRYQLLYLPESELYNRCIPRKCSRSEKPLYLCHLSDAFSSARGRTYRPLFNRCRRA